MGLLLSKRELMLKNQVFFLHRIVLESKYSEIYITKQIFYLSNFDFNMDEHCESLNKLGDNIRKERNKQGISQNQLAFECGLTRETINKIESGKLNVSVCNVSKIAKALNIDLKNLFDFNT